MHRVVFENINEIYLRPFELFSADVSVRRYVGGVEHGAWGVFFL